MTLKDTHLARREWLLIIAVLLMIEYWLISTSYEFKSSETLVSYISFAATIASILLAVIAIIYSFVQADAQQTASAAMLAQIDSLRSTASGLSSSSLAITEQVTQITKSSESLKILENTIETANQKLLSLEGHISGIKGGQDAVVTAIQRITEKAPQQESSRVSNYPEDIAYLLFQRSSFDADLFGYMLSRFIDLAPNKRPDLAKTLRALYIEPVNAFRQREKTEGAPFIMLEKAYLIISIARGLGIVSIDQSKFEVIPKFIDSIRRAAAETKKSETDYVKKTIILIDAATEKLAAEV